MQAKVGLNLYGEGKREVLDRRVDTGFIPTAEPGSQTKILTTTMGQENRWITVSWGGRVREADSEFTEIVRTAQRRRRRGDEFYTLLNPFMQADRRSRVFT